MWEAVHSAADFHVYIPVVGALGSKIVLFDDFVGNVFHLYAEVLVTFHGSHEVGVFAIHCDALGSRCGHNAVEEELHRDEVGGGGADCAGVVDFVATW